MQLTARAARDTARPWLAIGRGGSLSVVADTALGMDNRAPRPYPLQVGPALAGYLGRLPEGIDSYPECRAKASLYRGLLDTLPLTATELPRALVELIEHPRPVTDWIPEVHSHAILLAQYDEHFVDEASYFAHCFASQRRLWSSKLYSFMMRFVSPARMVASVSQRWSQFHRGSSLTASAVDAAGADVLLETPPDVYCPLSLGALTEGLRAVLDRSAIAATIELVESSPTGGRWRASWG